MGKNSLTKNARMCKISHGCNGETMIDKGSGPTDHNTDSSICSELVEPPIRCNAKYTIK